MNRLCAVAQSRERILKPGVLCAVFIWGKAGSGDILVCADWKELSVISCQLCGNLGRVCTRAWDGLDGPIGGG